MVVGICGFGRCLVVAAGWVGCRRSHVGHGSSGIFLTRRLGGYFQSNQQKRRSNTIEKFSNPNYEKEVGPKEKQRMWLRRNR